MNLRFFLVAILTCGMLVGCYRRQKDEDTIPRVAQRDPAIEVQARNNAALYNQTPARMYKTKKLPSITYEFDSVRPPEYAYELLDKVATVMNEHESIHLIMEGHADLIGTDEYNYWISGARAAALKSYIVSRGVAADRIRIHAYGKERPITLDTSSEGRRANRRVELQFTNREWKAIF